MDEQQMARAAELGEALQRGLAAQVIAVPAYAASPVVMGLDALSSLMQHNPATLADFGPMLSVAVECYNYAMTGDCPDSVAGILAGRLPSAFGA